MKQQSLYIIIPAYNEENRIGRTLEEYASFFEKKLKKELRDYSILVVINNTTDNTESIVKQYQKKYKRINYLNLPGGGKGYAVSAGFKEALKGKMEIIGFVDADLATTPEEFAKLIPYISEADAIIASRYLKSSVMNPPPSIQRVFSSRVYNSLIRALFLLPYRDTQCGAKIFRRKAIESSCDSFTMSQWAFDLDIIYNIRKKGFSIKEVPTAWSDRKYSKINFLKAGPRMALGIIRLRLINSPFKGFIRLYDTLIG